MADNTTINPGVGGNVMSDEDIGGVHVSRVKIVLGAHGIDGGDVDGTNPLPVVGTFVGIVTAQGFDADGAPPTGNPVLIAGWDGVNVQTLLTDTAGRSVLVGAGIAGVPAGGVVSVQGVVGGTDLDTNIAAWFGATTPTVGQKTTAASIPVTIASDQPAVPSKETRASTGTTSNVAQNVANVTLLAANANRIGAIIYNDSVAVLFVKFAATASFTSYTVPMIASATLTINNYTGIIDGIWAAAGAGAARVTELT